MEGTLAANRMRIALDFTGVSLPLYDVFIIVHSHQVNRPPERVLAHFDRINVSELSDFVFIVDADAALEVVGASVPGMDLDVALTNARVYARSSVLIPPARGRARVFLQMRGALRSHEYSLVEEGTITAERFPAPRPDFALQAEGV